MRQMIMRLLVGILAILSSANSQMTQPQVTIKAENNKAFDESCLIGTFNITKGNIADCLERCLENCSCQSFQVCQNTQCQLCSSNKEDNNSLLHDKKDCVYAMYEMQGLTQSFQKMNDQCSAMGCLLKYNCCQQSGLCPKKKICKPVYNMTQPWKRFSCECPVGYHGSSCEELIPSSCRGFANRSGQHGIYKVVRMAGSKHTLYKVYCHFDTFGAWTLVQSYSFANVFDGQFQEFRKPLHDNAPVNKNTPTAWSGYRLNKARMRSIQNSYPVLRLRFTCDYEKHHDIEKSDYFEMPLLQYTNANKNNTKIIDILKSANLSSSVFEYSGKIGGIQLTNCLIWLHQSINNKSQSVALHIVIKRQNSQCNILFSNFPTKSIGSEVEQVNYFGQYWSAIRDENHHCVINGSSTTQVWFGN